MSGRPIGALLAGEGPVGRYRLAGRTVTIRPEIPGLAAFARPQPTEPPEPRDEAPVIRAIASVRGIVADTERNLACDRTSAGYRIRVEQVGEYHVFEERERILLASELAASPLVVSALLGPVASMALALDDTWTLHASAVRDPERGTALFLGPSGAGKSTLARFLTGGRYGGLAVSDDILPVTLEPTGLVALPRFPQPRWATDRQAGAESPETLPVDALFFLERPANGKGEPRAEPMSPRQAALAVIQQTVAGALFDDRLLERHLAFAGAVAESVPVHRLVYSLRMENLPKVEALVAGRLETRR